MYRFLVRDDTNTRDVSAHATVREAFEAANGRRILVECLDTGTRCKVLRP